ncbi:MAG: adenine nucleotide alpha hydrolase family protein, partial [Acidimicrobiales bacterium]
SVPAFIAARLGASQALGLISLPFDEATFGASTFVDGITAERRLDRGRRERVTVRLPAVLSVEGGSARLRRASLAGVLDGRCAEIGVVAGPSASARVPVRTSAFRPRARVLPPPAGATALERVLSLTGALTDRTPPQRLVLDPPDAADRIVEQLRAWGYVE